MTWNTMCLEIQVQNVPTQENIMSTMKVEPIFAMPARNHFSIQVINIILVVVGLHFGPN